MYQHAINLHIPNNPLPMENVTSTKSTFHNPVVYSSERAYMERTYILPQIYVQDNSQYAKRYRQTIPTNQASSKWLDIITLPERLRRVLGMNGEG